MLQMTFDDYVGETRLHNIWQAHNTPTHPTNDERPHPHGIWREYPQNQVTFYDAVIFLNRLSILAGRTPVYSLVLLPEDTPGSAMYNSLMQDLSLLNVSNRPMSFMGVGAWGTHRVVKNRSTNGFRLPTDAEWEYAARGGQQNEYTRTFGRSGIQYRFSGGNIAVEVGNFYSAILAPVWRPFDHPSQIKANQLGIYEMSGNIYEWVWDFSQVVNDWNSIHCCTVSNPIAIPLYNLGVRRMRGSSAGSGSHWSRLARGYMQGNSDQPSRDIGIRIVMNAQ